MSTAINITVDDGGLPARNRQQVAANRQALVQKIAREQSTALGVDKRSQERIAQGRDPATGALLIPPASTGALGAFGGGIPRLNQQPAANRVTTRPEGDWVIDFAPPLTQKVDETGVFLEGVFINGSERPTYRLLSLIEDAATSTQITVKQGMGGRYMTRPVQAPVTRSLGLYVNRFVDNSAYTPFKPYKAFSCESRFYIPYPNQPIYDNVQPDKFAERRHTVACAITYDEGFNIFVNAAISSFSSNYSHTTEAFLQLGLLGFSTIIYAVNIFNPSDLYDTLKLVYAPDGRASLFLNGNNILTIAGPAALTTASKNQFRTAITSDLTWPNSTNIFNFVLNEPDYKIGKAVYSFF
jgi:hypothetical protein